jgi:hypothetical protein
MRNVLKIVSQIIIDAASQEITNKVRQLKQFSVKFDVNIVVNQTPTQAQAPIHLRH